MCMIYLVHKTFPSMRLLDKAAEKNRDGAGVAWWDKDAKTVRWIKGLKSEPNDVQEVLKKITNLPAMIHFRSASAGGAYKALTHPFPLMNNVPLSLEGKTDALLMHNGHWPSWKETLRDFSLKHKIVLPEGPWSDTRAMALLASYLGRNILPLLDSIDRIAVIDSKGNTDSWGRWEDPEKDHKETGFSMSTTISSYGNSYCAPGGSTTGGSKRFGDEASDAEEWNEYCAKHKTGEQGGEKKAEAVQTSSPTSPADRKGSSSPGESLLPLDLLSDVRPIRLGEGTSSLEKKSGPANSAATQSVTDRDVRTTSKSRTHTSTELAEMVEVALPGLEADEPDTLLDEVTVRGKMTYFSTNVMEKVLKNLKKEHNLTEH